MDYKKLLVLCYLLHLLRAAYRLQVMSVCTCFGLFMPFFNKVINFLNDCAWALLVLLKNGFERVI